MNHRGWSPSDCWSSPSLFTPVRQWTGHTIHGDPRRHSQTVEANSFCLIHVSWHIRSRLTTALYNPRIFQCIFIRIHLFLKCLRQLLPIWADRDRRAWHDDTLLYTIHTSLFTSDQSKNCETFEFFNRSIFLHRSCERARNTLRGPNREYRLDIVASSTAGEQIIKIKLLKKENR